MSVVCLVVKLWLGERGVLRSLNDREMFCRCSCLLEGVEGILSKLRARGKIADKETNGAPSQSILQYSRELGVAVRNAALCGWGRVEISKEGMTLRHTHGALVEGVHDLTENAEGLVDRC